MVTIRCGLYWINGSSHLLDFTLLSTLVHQASGMLRWATLSKNWHLVPEVSISPSAHLQWPCFFQGTHWKSENWRKKCVLRCGWYLHGRSGERTQCAATHLYLSTGTTWIPSHHHLSYFLPMSLPTSAARDRRSLQITPSFRAHAFFEHQLLLSIEKSGWSRLSKIASNFVYQI